MMEKKLTVDRIAAGVAICEDEARKMREIPLEELPSGTKEGDVLLETAEGFQPAPEEREQRRKRNQALFAQLVKRKKPSSETAEQPEQDEKTPPESSSGGQGFND